MVNVGIVGIGFMGMTHFNAYEKVRGAKVVALCEQDEKRIKGDWRDIQGNFGPRGKMMDLSGMQATQNYEELLANDQVDMVDICLPPAMHADFTIKALAAGKHVFCEKPMALDSKDCDRMMKAARQSGKLLHIGHVLPLFPEYADALKMIQSGEHGKLLGGSFKRVISDPQWLPNFYDPRKVGGPMLDLHVHDAHFIRLLFGRPTAVSTQGRMRGEVLEYFQSQFEFENPNLVVSATSGVINQQGRAFTHGFEIHLEGATLQYEMAVVGGKPETLMPVTLYSKEGKVKRPKIGGGDPSEAFELEIKEVVACVKKGELSPVLAGELARDAVILCNKQTESAVRGRKVKV